MGREVFEADSVPALYRKLENELVSRRKAYIEKHQQKRSKGADPPDLPNPFDLDNGAKIPVADVFCGFSSIMNLWRFWFSLSCSPQSATQESSSKVRGFQLAERHSRQFARAAGQAS